MLLIAAVVGALAVRLRQPMLIAYIVVGIAVGPAELELVKAHDQIDLLAQIGVAVLLFLVGLKLDLPHVRHIGPVALATGLGQLAFTIAIGFVLILAMGRDWITALYVAVAPWGALALSSGARGRAGLSGAGCGCVPGTPPICTGVAAPRLVPGDMAGVNDVGACAGRARRRAPPRPPPAPQRPGCP